MQSHICTAACCLPYDKFAQWFESEKKQAIMELAPWLSNCTLALIIRQRLPKGWNLT